MRAAIITTAAIVAACAPVTANGGQDDLAYVDPAPGFVKVVTDPLTGCEYLMTSPSGITPRLNAYGQPRCGRNGK